MFLNVYGYSLWFLEVSKTENIKEFVTEKKIIQKMF